MEELQAKSKLQRPEVISQPQVGRSFQAGINQIVKAIAPTLGPLHRTVAINSIEPNKPPEILDNGALIARRLTMLNNRDQDVGAMYLRQMICKVDELSGDGTATSAVLFQTIYNQGLRHINAGTSSMILRRYLEEGALVICNQLNKMAMPLRNKQVLDSLVRSVCHDPELAEAIANIFDVIGPYHRLNVHGSRGREIETKYIDGNFWEGGLIHRSLSPVGTGKIIYSNAPIVITDFDIQHASQLIPLIELSARNSINKLILIVRNMSEQVIGLLTAPATREKIQITVIRSHVFTGTVNREALQDLALLTGGQALLEKAGYTLDNIQVSQLGYSRRAWADKDFFGIIGGKGDSRLVRQQIDNLKLAFDEAQKPDDRKRIVDRLQSLLGDTAELWVGSSSLIGIERRQAEAKRAIEVIRGGLREGVVPGAGMALLNCINPLREKYRQARNDTERIAYRILLSVVEIPLRTLLQNAGYRADAILAQLEGCSDTCGFDIVRGQIIDMANGGVYDPVSVVKTAVSCAISSAALALTIDVVVHRTNPPREMKP